MNSHYKFVSTVFLTAALGTLISTVASKGIVLLFLFMGIKEIVWLPKSNKMIRSDSSWQIEGIKKTVILGSLLVFCTLLPQVETNTAVLTSPVEDLKNSFYHS